MTTPRILALCGSLRTDSFNKKLLAIAIAEARTQGAEVDVVEPKSLGLLPIYDQDVEDQGWPEPVKALRERLGQARGLLISSPEYNSSIPGSLKNTLDWLSRPPERLFQDKWAAMLGASPSLLGTARMQPHLRQVLASVGANVVTTQMHIPKASDVFTAEGQFKDEARRKDVVGVVSALLSRVKG